MTFDLDVDFDIDKIVHFNSQIVLIPAFWKWIYSGAYSRNKDAQRATTHKFTTPRQNQKHVA